MTYKVMHPDDLPETDLALKVYRAQNYDTLGGPQCTNAMFNFKVDHYLDYPTTEDGYTDTTEYDLSGDEHNNQRFAGSDWYSYWDINPTEVYPTPYL